MMIEDCGNEMKETFWWGCSPFSFHQASYKQQDGKIEWRRLNILWNWHSFMTLIRQQKSAIKLLRMDRPSFLFDFNNLNSAPSTLTGSRHAFHNCCIIKSANNKFISFPIDCKKNLSSLNSLNRLDDNEKRETNHFYDARLMQQPSKPKW